MMMHTMKRQFVLVAALAFATLQAAYAQQSRSSAEEAQYTRVITARSQKIVDQLGITDTAKAGAVRDVLVSQYRRLGKVYDWRQAEKKSLKQSGLSSGERTLRQNQVDSAADLTLMKYHRNFIGRLSAVLTPEQVDKVKDAMTYNVLHVTYQAYLDMLPNLTQPQKDTILSDLIEAREYSMDGGSSEEKHWWFGKYKGRINNFLSREGVNMDEARKAWAARRAAGKN
jgi:hypothetical protein